MGDLWHLKLDGDAWEHRCHVLLALKYDLNYEPITDSGGDCGIDGINRAKKTAYQAYGIELENKDPVNGCKQKIWKDLRKLQQYSKEIQQILGDDKLSHWALLLNRNVPSNDIHRYLKDKEAVVKTWGLPFLSDNFQAIILDPSYLETEHLEYLKRRDDRVEVDVELIAPPNLSEMTKTENFKKVLGKFMKINSAEKAEALTYHEVKNHIEQSIILDELRKREPDFYSEIEEIHSEMEKEAALDSMFEGTFGTYSSIKSTLETRLNNKIGARLSATILGRVRKFIIADWLVRCPLDFVDQGRKDD